MNKSKREEKIKSLGFQFEKAVKGISPYNVSVVIARTSNNQFHEIDPSRIYPLDQLPPCGDNEWFCPAIFDGNNYRYISLPPEAISSEEHEEYSDARYYENYEPENYEYNWGFGGQGLKQVIQAYRNAEAVWIGDLDSTGNIPLDRYLSFLKSIDLLYPIKKRQADISNKISKEEHDFKKIEGDIPELRKISDGVPTDLVKCNRRFDRIVPKLEAIKDEETLVLLEEVFQAGQYGEKFHHPDFLNKCTSSSLPMELARIHEKNSADWRSYTKEFLRRSPHLPVKAILNEYEKTGVATPEGDYWVMFDKSKVKHSSLPPIISKLRKQIKNE